MSTWDAAKLNELEARLKKQVTEGCKEMRMYSEGTVAHDVFTDCLKATARRCAEIADTHSPFMAPGTKIDHRLIAATIRREFNLGDRLNERA